MKLDQTPRSLAGRIHDINKFCILLACLFGLPGCSSTVIHSATSPGVYSHLVGNQYRTRVPSVLTSNLWSPKMTWDDSRNFDIPAGIDFVIVGVEVSDTPFVGIVASPIAELQSPLKGRRRLLLSCSWARDKSRNGAASLEYSDLDPKLTQQIR